MWQGYEDAPVLERIVHPLGPQHRALHGVRIVQLSDLHVGRYMRAEHWAAHIARVNALAPDLVVITGDAMDWARRYEADFIEPLASLTPRVASLAILGNHDFYFGAERLAAGYRRSGTVTLLRGARWESIALPGLSIWGIDDPMTALAARAPYERLAGWTSSLDGRRYNVLLSHRPDAFHRAPALGFDLQLSGHTHGGQIVLSTQRGRRWHIASVLGPWDQGSFEASHARRQSRLYVSRGLGFAGVPYRRSCPTEITIHELELESVAVKQAS